jgi:hypothetical protein
MAPKQNYNKANYQKNTNLVQEHQFAGQRPTVKRIKTDGRIGSATPPEMLKGGFTVDNNQKVQPHHGKLGSVAAAHMTHTFASPGVYQPRVKQARARAIPNAKAYANPVNVDRPSLKHVKPD